ncbi:diphosphomevalonate decarboxylase [Paracrocinitomix mangrovi]|uniref:diphosphomevalonate/mevalonate 3,5-bisphosphate decarboxylase family protein n=1 Tax=Paracrocinitomix mangrovi TaxID=2862509 RepID=UPI001C8E3E7D|nr:diphosphomevalonate decarboxylase [Paracrocinitomix mangrovi]UKN02489.1 diphosphomevalonate decarboxylase [Paracrocinitomix mangrovi]
MGNTTETTNEIKVKWRCPSNIAIVKYWGKKSVQIPCNPSLSLTLSNSYTEVEVTVSEKTTHEQVELTYYFEGEENQKFGNRVAAYLADNIDSFPYLNMVAVTIQSKNSFPHSAGIASSASAFGAIALAMLDIAYQFEEKEIDDDFYQKASELARLGSGSACRSVFPSYSIWGEVDGIEGTSNEYAVGVHNIHPIFKNYKDAILIVEDEPKKISSTVGHSLMNDHPFAEIRFKQAEKRTKELVDILEEGDIDSFIQICESDALTLHAMMMTSTDYYLLVKPGTITAIEKIMQFRLENLVPVCFTLDAGPNVHVLYPEKYQDVVEEFINTELKDTYKKVIFDHEGEGPQKLSI